MDFLQKLKNTIEKNNSLLCIGLDTDLEKLPKDILKQQDSLFTFNKAIVDATASLVCSYKINSAFYEAYGTSGLLQLKKTIDYIHHQYTSIMVILDSKRADIGSTNNSYVKFAFDYLNSDSVTVNPYLGMKAIEPFLERKDHGIIILCKTSNPGAEDFQDLKINGEFLYEIVAKKIVEVNQKYGNCLMVVGGTYPEELKKVRKIAKDMFFLIPGIGKQGGDLEKTLENGLTNKKSGLIIHSSRAIIYASSGRDFADIAKQKAKELKNEINRYRK